jgi:hypothetical protein
MLRGISLALIVVGLLMIWIPKLAAWKSAAKPQKLEKPIGDEPNS